MKKINRMHKKSQMEAYGLAVIVVLVIIGIFLIVSLRSQMKSPSYKANYVYQQMPNDFVTSLISVTPKECNINIFTVSDLLRACALNEDKRCGSYGACELAEKTIESILNDTLVKQNYAFRLYTENLDPEISFINRECTSLSKSDKGRTGVALITKYPRPEPILMKLEICID